MSTEEEAFLDSVSAAVQECIEKGMPKTANALDKARIYLLANRLTPEQQKAFLDMIAEVVQRDRRAERDLSFWNTLAGKATVFSFIVAGGAGLVTSIITMLREFIR